MCVVLLLVVCVRVRCSLIKGVEREERELMNRSAKGTGGVCVCVYVYVYVYVCVCVYVCVLCVRARACVPNTRI